MSFSARCDFSELFDCPSFLFPFVAAFLASLNKQVHPRFRILAKVSSLGLLSIVMQQAEMLTYVFPTTDVRNMEPQANKSLHCKAFKQLRPKSFHRSRKSFCSTSPLGAPRAGT